MSTLFSHSAEVKLNWQQLPSLPDPIGFGGPIGGVSGGALIVGGGSNFTNGMPWEGGAKSWYDTAFVLEQPAGKWKSGLKLPHVCAYAVSVTTPDGVICIGGADAQKHLTNVFRLVWEKGRLNATALAPLPLPIAYACGASVNDSVYIAGGTDSPDAARALKKFLRLDLKTGQWEELDPWPGPARMLAVAASVRGSFYLAGGANLAPDANGKPARTYLTDAYYFTPGQGWNTLASMPHPAVAAPTPAPNTGEAGFMIVGGDDGSLVNFEPKSKHPGFPKRVLLFDAQKNAWSVEGEVPASRATLPTAPWRGRVALISGEARPGVRSPEVWSVSTP
jgi:N-acetylneuraminic acid mutarotase